MIAYFILVHRYPKQFKRLFKSIYDSKNHYLIHVDKKAGDNLYIEVKKFLKDYPNTNLLKTQNIVWGGYSMVDAELRGIKKLLKLSLDWDFFINLSGQDFPLKSQTYIQNFLRGNIGKDFILVSDQVKMRPNTLNRIDNYFVESENGFSGLPIKRNYLSNVIPYIGGQWKILSRGSCEFICSSPEVSKIKNYYKNTLIPDESFFQTALMNTNSKANIINDDKRAIIWIPDIAIKLLSKVFIKNQTKALIESGEIKLRPKTFTIKDLPFLLSSTSFFARKFDETVDSAIIKILESRLKVLKPKTLKKKLPIKLNILTQPLQNVLQLTKAESTLSQIES